MNIFRHSISHICLIILCLLHSPRLHGAACSIPAEAQLEDVSNPDQVIGDGTPESCTSEAFVEAVALGGIITFDCGPEPVTITLDETAKIFNKIGDNTTPEIVIDGGNLVTLSGGGERRILYMNTCDPNQIWTTSHCNNQNYPHLTVQNLTFAEGNSTSETEYTGGGAIWVRGGRFKILNSRFVRNVCAPTGPDVGGAAVRVFSQYNTLPVYVVNSVFGGREEDANVCSNGGGLSSIGVSYTVINSLFSNNKAIGLGGNPAKSGTPGGGSGAAIYNDGNTFHLNICGTAFHDNLAQEYAASIFFVSNDRSGTMTVSSSGLWNNGYIDYPADYPSGISQYHWETDTGGVAFLGLGSSPSFIDTYRSNNTVFERYQTIDVDGDEKIGLAEVLHALATISSSDSPELSMYARMLGDIDYNHRINLKDVIKGLQLAAGTAP